MSLVTDDWSSSLRQVVCLDSENRRCSIEVNENLPIWEDRSDYTGVIGAKAMKALVILLAMSCCLQAIQLSLEDVSPHFATQCSESAPP
jgi:hypothetical protein